MFTKMNGKAYILDKMCIKIMLKLNNGALQICKAP